MSPVEFKKRPCRPVEFKGQGPHTGVAYILADRWSSSRRTEYVYTEYAIALGLNPIEVIRWHGFPSSSAMSV